VIEAGEPVAIPNQEGKLTTPSVVAFLDDGSVLIGDTAKRCVTSRLFGLAFMPISLMSYGALCLLDWWRKGAATAAQATFNFLPPILFQMSQAEQLRLAIYSCFFQPELQYSLPPNRAGSPLSPAGSRP
jgi:hypothetical protein